MPITQLTPQASIDDYLDKGLGANIMVMTRNLAYAGEQSLNIARSTNSYRDQTGNLRSSIGYVLVSDGRVIRSSSFETVKTGGEGSVEGKQFANQLVSQFPKGIVLIIVAGMNYAKFVAARGFDVLDSAELFIDGLKSRLLKPSGPGINEQLTFDF